MNSPDIKSFSAFCRRSTENWVRRDHSKLRAIIVWRIAGNDLTDAVKFVKGECASNLRCNISVC